MDPILVLVADQARARLFLSETRVGKLKEISDFASPESRLHEGDLITGETGGRYYQATYVEDNAVERSVETFAISLSSAMDKFVEQHRPSRIHVIAPPKFLGLLRTKWSKTVKGLIAEEITKDVSNLSPEEIRERLPDFV